MDIHGNVLHVGDHVYTCHAARAGSDSKRMLYCRILELSTSGAKATLLILENDREINKTTACCVKPAE